MFSFRKDVEPPMNAADVKRPAGLDRRQHADQSPVDPLLLGDLQNDLLLANPRTGQIAHRPARFRRRRQRCLFELEHSRDRVAFRCRKLFMALFLLQVKS